MKIEKIGIKLPKKEKSIEKFFKNCEKRKKFVNDTEEHYKKHLKKAKHDLTRAIAEFKDECWDWTVIKAYYAIHHAGNALLSKNKNQYSKDHSCLIIALKHHNLIDEVLFEELIKINKKFSDVLSVDEWEELTREDAGLIINVAKKFIKFVEEKI